MRGEPFTLKNGGLVFIEIEPFNSAKVFDANGQQIGEFQFAADGDWRRILLAWMYLDFQGQTYLHQGIGEACLRAMIEATGASVYVRPNDGIVREDGSHLTGDAAAFVQAMRSKGLVLPGVDEERMPYEFEE